MQCTVLVTSGIGSFGRKLTKGMLEEYHPRKLIIFSRDELKQQQMQMARFDHPAVRYCIRDVHDPRRLQRAMKV